MVFLPNLSVHRRCCLCGGARYASAQQLDFLDLGQKSTFVNEKHQHVPMLILTIYGWALVGDAGWRKAYAIKTYSIF